MCEKLKPYRICGGKPAIDEFGIKEGEVIGNIHDNPELMEVNDG